MSQDRCTKCTRIIEKCKCDPAPVEGVVLPDSVEILWEDPSFPLDFVRNGLEIEFNAYVRYGEYANLSKFLAEAIAQRDAQRLNYIQELESMGMLRNEWMKRAEQAEASLATARAQGREEGLREDAEKINTPETEDFFKGVPLEAAHQRARWGNEHDSGKEPADWFWLIGYLAGKCLAAHIGGNRDKALHHTISTAAALANWHMAIKGAGSMRPGIEDPSALIPKK
jgi:hypothetical protein